MIGPFREEFMDTFALFCMALKRGYSRHLLTNPNKDIDKKNNNYFY